MKMLRKLTVALLVVAMLVMLLPGMSVFAADKKVVIFHTNDVHGRGVGTPELDKNGNPNESGQIGYARYKTIIDAEKAKAEVDEVIVLDAGDAVHGMLFSLVSRGKSIIDLMNLAGVDAMTVGNHEFDYGRDRLLELDGFADFPIMAGNLKKDGSNLLPTNHKVFEVDGKKIVVFGIATPETKVKAHPDYTSGVSFGAGGSETDLAAFAATVQGVIDGLPAADFVIMLGHLGIDSSSSIRTTTLLPLLTGVDFVIDGHSHSRLPDGGMVKDKDGKEVKYAQTGSYFENIGKVTLTVGDSVSVDEIQLIPFKDVRGVAEDPAVVAKVAEYETQIDTEMSVKIGKTSELLLQNIEGLAIVRIRETNLGDMVADALLKSTGADVAMTNGGGIRENIPAGDITYAQALAVLPFGNLITVIKVTGQDIVDALEWGAGKYPAPNGGFPQVAGMSYVIVTEGEGEEEAFVRIADVLVDGKPIDLKKEYTLASNDFMAAGGDGYTMFEGKEIILKHGMMLEAFIELIEDLSGKAGAKGFSYPEDGRIMVMSVEDMEPTVPTGEPVTYVAAGVVMLLVAGLFFQMSRRKREEH